MKCIKWPGFEAEIYNDKTHCAVDLISERRTLSSSVLNGGFTNTRFALNIRVNENPESSSAYKNLRWDPPEVTLENFAVKKGYIGRVSGMMTAADMGSFRVSLRNEKWGGVFCVVTAGLSNARAPGDKGEYSPSVKGESIPAGTINIIAGTNLNLSDAA
ncbi:MAG: hypothetical protein GY786_23165, partial [Proteobacteria bacterium]|nr:hypothetical protein [Pseudomonadota bacterium]